jgi:hypothetical protein
MGERRTAFAKAYGIKMRCSWELLPIYIHMVVGLADSFLGFRV